MKVGKIWDRIDIITISPYMVVVLFWADFGEMWATMKNYLGSEHPESSATWIFRIYAQK